MAATIPTGVVTFLFTDVEGSTELWSRRPDAAPAAFERHDRIVRRLLDRGGGHVFSTAGDSFGAAFQDAATALEIAGAIQQALSAESWPEGVELRVRIGLHLGASHERDGNYFGSDVNLAARVEQAAHGGQILVTAAVAEVAKRWEMRPLGEHRLRGIDEAVDLVQVVPPGCRVDFPPLRSESTMRTNLPAAWSATVGRDADIDTVRALMRSHRMITLTGSGGVGKTTLAIEIARRELAEPGSAAWLIDLSRAPRAAAVAPIFGVSFGLGSDRPEHIVRQLGDVLARRSMLLVVDNCEHVLDSLAPLLRELLDRCPQLRVLATSREVLAVPGERAWRVPSLPADGAAVQLFEQRAIESDSSFVLDRSETRVVIEICRRLDGIPLAIELAASRVRTLSVPEIHDGLTARFRLLSGSRRGVADRQTTLEQTISWSYELLTPDEQTVLGVLGVFAEHFDVGALAAVADRSLPDAMAVVDSLVAKSLVEPDRRDRDGGGRGRSRSRYRLLESVRTFALERLEEQGLTGQVRDRHLAHYLSTDAAGTELRVATVRDRLRVHDFANLRAAADHALATDRPLDATRLTIGRALTILQHGDADAGLRWFAGRRGLGINDQLWALNGCVVLAMATGRHETAREFVEESLQLAGDTPFDALPNTYFFAALNALFDTRGAAMTMIERAIAMALDTPSGAAHLEAVHQCRSLVHLHERRWDAALADAALVLGWASDGSLNRGEARVQQLAAFAATGRTEELGAVLDAIVRPAPIRLHEWSYRLFELLRATRPLTADVVRALAIEALATAGGDPVQRATDLVAALAWRALGDEVPYVAADDAVAGISTSAFGALAVEAVGRSRGWNGNDWVDGRAVLGHPDGIGHRRAEALRIVTGLADGA